MSWQATSWAARQKAGNTGKKALLLLIANTANAEGVCWVGRVALAQECECRPETITANLACLEASNLISRHRRTRVDGSRTTDWIVLAPQWEDRGDLRDADSDSYDEPVRKDAQAGGKGKVRISNLAETSPEISEGPSLGKPGGHEAVKEQPQRNKEAREDKRLKIPDDFPGELRPHAREVMRILSEVAEQHGAPRVWPLAVARTVMAHPRHPLVATAHDLAVWAVDPSRAVKDVVSTYKTFLKRGRELQTTERLAADGTPCGIPGVRHAHNGKPSPAQLLAELNAANPRLQARAAEAGNLNGHAVRQLTEGV